MLLFIVAEIGFVAAARWQWQRGAFKDQRAREFAAALAADDASSPLDFPALDRLPGDFAAAHLHGRLLIDRVYLHDNRIVEGEYGVDVYVPLAIDGGYVLVNLGWVAADRSRRISPVVPLLLPDFDARGLIAPAPAPGLMYSGRLAPAPSQPEQLRLDIDPLMIAQEAPRLEPMLDRVFWPAPELASPFRRDWKPSGMAADRHRGYALQWASFAVASLILFLMFHLRRKEVRP
ncbi:MAG: SURF1 family protein [Rhodanobacteraceae bacterium]|nr:SURF1 family protein [Rhodanobacteraceae bacterium]